MDFKNLDTKQKIVLSVAALAALYGLVYVVMWIVVMVTEGRNRKTGTQSQNKNQNQSQDGQSGGASTRGTWPTSPLRWGSGTSRNKDVATAKSDVRQLQKLCNKWTGAGLVVDGIWGDKTEAAMQRLKTVSVYHTDNPTRLLTPFAAYVVPVEEPASPVSKVQVWIAGANSMMAWHNANYKSYKTYSTEPIK